MFCVQVVGALVQHNCSQWLLEFAKLRTCQPTLVELMAQLTISTAINSAQRRMRCWLLLLTPALMVWSSAHGAVTDEWLYTVQQQVVDQSEEQRQIAAREALLEVLSRVTGLTTIPRNATITSALERPDRFYSEYVFVRTAGTNAADADDALALEIRFQDQVVLDLVREAKLPIWWSGRPMSLAWVVVEQDAQRTVLRDGGDTALASALLRQAQRRGLPLALPLLDLQDTMRVSPGIVWGNFLPTLAAATERYGVQQLLIGRMRAETYGQDTFYSGDWQIAFANDLEPVTSNFSGLSAAQVANLGTELATTYFAPSMTIFSGDQFEYGLRVAGVAELSQYKRMLDYFRQFEFVNDVVVSSIVDGNMNLSVSTAASEKLLLSLLTREGQLQSLDEATLGTEINLLWRD